MALLTDVVEKKLHLQIRRVKDISNGRQFMTLSRKKSICNDHGPGKGAKRLLVGIELATIGSRGYRRWKENALGRGRVARKCSPANVF